MSEWTPAEVSVYDQALAGADTELDNLVAMLRHGTAEAGERQAMANVGLFLTRRDDRASLVGLLAAALRRLAAEER